MQHASICGGCVNAFINWLETSRRQANCSSCEVSLEHIGKRFVSAPSFTIATIKQPSVKLKKKTAPETTASRVNTGLKRHDHVSEASRSVIKIQEEAASTKPTLTTISTANHSTTENHICRACEGLFKYNELYCYQKSGRSIRRTHLNCIDAKQVSDLRAHADADSVQLWLETGLTQEQADLIFPTFGTTKSLESSSLNEAFKDNLSEPDMPETKMTTNSHDFSCLEPPVLLPLLIEPQPAECSDDLKLSRLRQTEHDMFVRKCERARRAAVEERLSSSDRRYPASTEDDIDYPFLQRRRQAQTPKHPTTNRCRDSEDYLESVKNSYKTSRTVDLGFLTDSCVKPLTWTATRQSDAELERDSKSTSFAVQTDPYKSSKQSAYSTHDLVKRSTPSAASLSTMRRKRTLQDSHLAEIPKSETSTQERSSKAKQSSTNRRRRSPPIDLTSPVKRRSLGSDRERPLARTRV